MGRQQLLPGPRGIDALRTLDRIRLDPLTELGRLHEQWGDVCMIAAPGVRTVAMFHPDDIEQVYTRNVDNVQRGFAIRRARYVLGRGMLTTDGEEHARQRRAMQPCMARSRLAGYTPPILDCIDEMLDEIPAAGARIDLDAWCSELGMHMIAMILLGRSDRRGLADLSDAFDIIREQFTNMLLLHAPLRQMLPLPSSLALRRARRWIRRMGEQMLEAHGFPDPPDPNDPTVPEFYRLLFETPEQRRCPRRRLLDAAVTMILAGQETTANSLAWAQYLLGAHPEVAQRLRTEVDEVLPDGRRPTFDDVPKLAYARRVFMETIRMYPQCYTLMRTVTAPFQTPNVSVERGWDIILPQWTIHRDARWWTEPERFDPDRFEGASTHHAPGDRPRYAYFPFGGGRRMCIGLPIAQHEAVLVLARIAQRIDATPIPDEPAPTPTLAFSLGIGHHHMHLTPRAT